MTTKTDYIADQIERDLLAEKEDQERSELVAFGHEHLGAIDGEDGDAWYYNQETGEWVSVTGEELYELAVMIGRRLSALERGEDTTAMGLGGYSEWCSSNGTVRPLEEAYAAGVIGPR